MLNSLEDVTGPWFNSNRSCVRAYFREMLPDDINTGLINLFTGPNIKQCLEQVCYVSITNKNVCYACPGLEKTLELVCKYRFPGSIFPHGGCVGENKEARGFKNKGF